MNRLTRTWSRSNKNCCQKAEVKLLSTNRLRLKIVDYVVLRSRSQTRPSHLAKLLYCHQKYGWPLSHWPSFGCAQVVERKPQVCHRAEFKLGSKGSCNKLQGIIFTVARSRFLV